MDPAGSARRRLVLGSGAAIALAVARAGAQPLSNRPVRIVVPQSAGTTPDLIARMLQPRLQDAFGQPFVVENKPGASGAIGMEFVAKSPPDGHTVMVNVSTTLTIPLFYKSVPFDVLRSFQALSYVGSGNFVLVVQKDFPAKTLEELLAHVRARPGQLNYASPGAGTHHHLCMELLKQQAKLDLVHVPYKGFAQAFTDFMGGHVPIMFLPVQVAIGAQKEGKLHILGGTLRVRFPLYPDIPSLHELGIKGFEVNPWYGVWAPAGLPAELVNRYSAALRTILADATTREAFAKQGLVAQATAPEDLVAVAQREFRLWERVVHDAKIRPE